MTVYDSLKIASTDHSAENNVPEEIETFCRLRAVSYFSLQSYCTRNLSTRAARPLVARNEGVKAREEKIRDC